MNALSRALVQSMVAVFDPSGPVLEIGSRQVQDRDSHDLRDLFPGREYLGCDMEAGPGVDRIERLERLSFPDGWAGTVLCLNVLEHVWELGKGADEIRRVTAPGGLALAVTVFDFHIHGFPEDYWRLTPRALERLFDGYGSLVTGWQGDAEHPRMTFVLAFKSRRDGLEKLAERWRQEALSRWDGRKSVWDIFRAKLGGMLFGKRGFQSILHWNDLTIRVPLDSRVDKR